MIDKTFVERRVYNGAPVRRGYRVSAITCVQCDKDDKPVEVVKVPNQAEYSAGCPLHRGACFGHICVTPTGNLLPPHSLSFRSGDIRTQYYIASAKAFENDSRLYIEELKRTNYGKQGHLRSIMSTPVSGSARLVCVPHVYSDPRVVFISRNLASKILFCLIDVDESGIKASTYTERELREGDYIMLERAPSLSKFNNQPFKVLYWDNECLGVHPKVFSHFHGDYDGDEAHIYALGDPKSITEAKEWENPLDKNLMDASEYMRENFADVYGGVDDDGDMEFIRYTTLSFNEIQSGSHSLPIGDRSRMKTPHLKMFKQRLDSVPGTKSFLQDSIKGVKDIMRQQTSMGKIGDMSRVARISAMCFTRGRNGGTYVVTRKAKVLLSSRTTGSTGSPSVRCIMVLCRASSEAALHAHRVGSTEAVGIDLVSDLLQGRQNVSPGDRCSTLYVVKGMQEPTIRAAMCASWCCKLGELTVCVAPDDVDNGSILENVVGAYSPIVLSKMSYERRRDACRLALSVVFNYYDLETEGDDIEDLVEAFCYKTQSSKLPVTTRDGMFARGVGWMETVMACDYTKTPAMAGSTCAPHSATSATMCANFSML